jgi:hypothetical protein
LSKTPKEVTEFEFPQFTKLVLIQVGLSALQCNEIFKTTLDTNTLLNIVLIAIAETATTNV